MTATHGSKAIVYIDGVDISTYLNNASLALGAVTDVVSIIRRNPFPDGANQGAVTGTFDLSGIFDASDDDAPVLTLSALMGTDTAVLVDYYPTGLTGQRRTFDAKVSAYNEASPVGDLVAFAATLVLAGAITLSSD